MQGRLLQRSAQTFCRLSAIRESPAQRDTGASNQSCSSSQLAWHTTAACAHAQAAVSTSQSQSSSGSTGSSSYQWLLFPAAAAALTGTAAYAQQQQQARILPPQAVDTTTTGWVEQLARQDGVLEVLNADQMLTQEHPVLKKDHMFSALLRHELVKDLACFYDTNQQRVSCVVQLGSDVCGYPRVVHGGLTAAIFDECFGFLFFALKKQRALPFWGPAYTAQLEISYKSKIQAGRLLLCTTEVESIEGRKVWMKATMRDGPDGKVYATARALFVAPRPQKLLRDGYKYVMSGIGLAKSLE